MSTRDDSRLTHPLNVGYLVVGLVCLGIAGLWALHAADVVDTAQVGWLLPLTLVVAGAIGLVALATRGLTRRSDTSEEPYDSYEQPYEDAYDDHVTDLASLQAPAFRYPTGEGRDEPEATTVLPDVLPDARTDTQIDDGTDDETDDETDDRTEDPTTRIDPHEGGSR
jgi:hypothetical protein